MGGSGLAYTPAMANRSQRRRLEKLCWLSGVDKWTIWLSGGTALHGRGQHSIGVWAGQGGTGDLLPALKERLIVGAAWRKMSPYEG